MATLTHTTKALAVSQSITSVLTNELVSRVHKLGKANDYTQGYIDNTIELINQVLEQVGCMEINEYERQAQDILDNLTKAHT